MRVAWETVGNIVGRVVDRLRPADILDDLTSIGVDELSYRKHHQYITVVVDHARGRIVSCPNARRYVRPPWQIPP